MDVSATTFGQILMHLGYNIASTHDLIELLELRGDCSMRELLKHIYALLSLLL